MDNEGIFKARSSALENRNPIKKVGGYIQKKSGMQRTKMQYIWPPVGGVSRYTYSNVT